MPPEDLQTYLASKYMSGPKADAILAASKQHHSRKKSKRKHPKLDEDQSSNPAGTASGIILKDADEDSWRLKDDDEDEDIDPVVENVASFVGKSSADSKWSVIKPSEPVEKSKKEEELPSEPEDEQPQVVATGSGTVQGGLQTAAQIKAHLKSKKATPARPPGEEAPEEETIYRDSHGKKLDTKQLRAEEKRRQARELEKKMKKMEWGKGLVQREHKKADADELTKIAAQPFARTVDDKEMNDELKEKQRWNDPAAAFLTKSTKSESKASRPKYNGPPAPPNRYGIPPGFRWDGVDRSNGFERKLFQTGNDQKRVRAEAYSYSVDEM